MKRLFVLAALLPLAASAQTPPESYTLTITPQDVSVLGRALGNMPYNEVSALITKLDGQVRSQQSKVPIKDVPEQPKPK